MIVHTSTLIHPFRDIPSTMLGYQIVREGRRPLFPPDSPQAYVQLAVQCWQEEAGQRWGGRMLGRGDWGGRPQVGGGGCWGARGQRGNRVWGGEGAFLGRRGFSALDWVPLQLPQPPSHLVNFSAPQTAQLPQSPKNRVPDILTAPRLQAMLHRNPRGSSKQVPPLPYFPHLFTLSQPPCQAMLCRNLRGAGRDAAYRERTCL